MSQESSDRTREIPDLPPDDYRFVCIITIDGHGRPRQLEREYRKALERVLLNEFGQHAKLTAINRSDEVVITDSDAVMDGLDDAS